MYSKVLLKLIQESIFPVFGILVIYILTSIFSLRSVGYNVNLYNLQNFTIPKTDYILINSQNLLNIMIFVFFGFLYSVSKSLFFHKTHISPKISLSVFNLRMGFLIQDSFHLFSQTFVWLLFNFSILFVITILFILGLTGLYLFLISFFLTIIGTYLFILDIEYEVNSFESEDGDILV